MKTFKLAIKWGILFTLIALLWAYLMHILGYTSDKIDQFPMVDAIFFIPAVLLYVFALKDLKKQQGGTMSWLEGFLFGLYIGIVVMILTPLSQYITHTFIMPEYFQNNIEYAINTHKMSQTEAESYFSMTNYIIQSTIFAPIAGIITGAIIALFIKKK